MASKAAAATLADSKAAEAPKQEPISSGHFVFPDDGATYDGEYTAAAGVPRRHGRGLFANVHFTYEGAWSQDRMSGAGVYVTASGSRYEGDLCEDEFHGTGAYTWPDGAVYRGQWRRNKMHGQGEYVSADNVRWTGEFVNGMFFDGKAHIAVR